MGRNIVFRLFVVLALIPLTGCSDFLGFQTLPTYRYRVMVEVNTPEGVRRGSSVISVETHRGAGWTPAPYGTSWSVDGEAVTIDLGPRGKLFMTLRLVGEDYSWAKEALIGVIGGDVVDASAENMASATVQRIRALKGWHCLKGCRGEEYFLRHFNQDFPLFATFHNLADPKSIELIRYDGVDRMFGGKVALKDIKVMVTDEPVTRTILGVLPWLSDEAAMRRIPAQPPGASRIFYARIDKADFIREE